MKALTLWQPWASLCVLPRPCRQPLCHRGVIVHPDSTDEPIGMGPCPDCGDGAQPFKTIETRSWSAPEALIGQRIAIHAAKRRVDDPGRVGPFATWQWQGRSGMTDISEPDAREITLPLGAVVGTAVLTDCVPIYHIAQLIAGTGGALWPHIQINGTDHASLTDGTNSTDVSDQRPFGDFAPGRWAWLLDDVHTFDRPIECRGRQGVWDLPDDLQWLSARGVVKS